MNELFKMTYNKENWKCKFMGINYCVLLNKNNNNSYCIQGNVIGLKQISDDTFLIHRQITTKINHFGRFKLTSNKIIPEFSKDFKHFTFLSDDTILFDNDLVYSISKNCEVPESKWIKNKRIEVLVNDDKPYALFIEECIDPLKEYIQVLADIHTFCPISNAYSTLRDSTIKLTNTFTFKHLVIEDTGYIKIIKNHLFGIHDNFRSKGKKILLKEYNKN